MSRKRTLKKLLRVGLRRGSSWKTTRPKESTARPITSGAAPPYGNSACR